MRFTRSVTASADDLKALLLSDLDALETGLRPLASNAPLPGQGTLDVLAVDARGCPALIVIDLSAGTDQIGAALAHWEWVAANLSFITHLVPQLGVDPTQSPRLLVAASRFGDDALRLAACVPRPQVELYELIALTAGEQRGVISRRLPLKQMPQPVAVIDPLLQPATPAEARSLIRRMAEEMRDLAPAGKSVTLHPISAGIDVHIDGSRAGSILATDSGVEARRSSGEGALPVTDDAGCRLAVNFLTQPAPGLAAPARPVGQKTLAALTLEEIAEFEGLAAGERAPAASIPVSSGRTQPAGAPPNPPGEPEPAGVPLRPGSSWYVEN